MKRINEYRKLFQVDAKPTLGELKKKYRSLIKEWHPDKFQDDGEKAREADVMGRKVIDAYHFLVSIAPETHAANLEEYNTTINTPIVDWNHKGLLLEVDFLDGNTYEYFGVNKGLYIKFCQSNKQTRFAKRSIFNSFIYRKIKKKEVEV